MNISITEAASILTKNGFKFRIKNNQIEAWFRKHDRTIKTQPYEVVHFITSQDVIDLIDSPSGY